LELTVKGSGVSGLGIRVRGLGFRGLGFGVQSYEPGFGVLGLEVKV
jgi:hypothetical protein